MKKLYITTTLPYVNAEPHIAHAIEFVLADAIARYYKARLGDDNVYFNVGTDEHGQKIWDKSKSENLDIHEFTKKYSDRFKEFCTSFDVEYSFFYRTSKDYHYPVATAFWNEAMKNGDIYKKKYKGLYCVGCESFKLDKDLIDGKCPDHGTEPIELEEENYFFKLTKYREQIADYLQTEFVIPESDRKFAQEFIKNIEDISISRDKAKLSWGIPVPGDDTQVMYVWFDALSNYLGSLYFGSKSIDDHFDITDVRDLREEFYFLQLCGADNVRFQAIIWQAMLISSKIKFTDKLLVHSWILGSDGRKMSKTLGNVISPFEQLEKYGSEAVRFFFLACMSTTGNAIYDEAGFVDQFNSRVADNYGNLLNRVIVLIVKNNIKTSNVTNDNSAILNEVNQLKNRAEQKFEEYNIFEYLVIINDIATLVNKYVTETEPWKKEKTQEFKTDVLLNCFKALKIITELYKPIIPKTTAKAAYILESLKPEILVAKIARDEN